MDDELALRSRVNSGLLASNSLAVLERHYPDWGWMVGVDDVGGIMQVRATAIPGKWGFLLKIKNVDPEGRAIMRAGGELLERYRMHRGRRRPGDTQLLIRDAMGRAVPDM